MQEKEHKTKQKKHNSLIYRNKKTSKKEQKKDRSFKLHRMRALS